jgi:hypothetical protein
MIFSKIIMVLFFVIIFSCKNAPINSDQQSTIPSVKSTTTSVKRDYQNWSLAEKEAESSASQSYQLIEETKWNLASTINTKESFERYLLKYPNGKHSKVAEDSLLKLGNKVVLPDQSGQVSKKIDSWGYVYSLINYAKDNINTSLTIEAINEIFLILCENFPPQTFNSSHTDYLFRSSFIKALKENKTFFIAFAQKNQSEGHISVVVQELVGKEININYAKPYWKGDPCTAKTWTHQGWNNINILPYGNSMIDLNYNIPCKIISLGIEIASNQNSISVLTIGTESASESLIKYLKENKQ